MIFIDAGTTYFKCYNSDTATYNIYNVKDYPKILKKFNKVDYATGHTAKVFKPKVYVNELVALSKASTDFTNKYNEFVVLDVGSRDIKLVKYKNGRFDYLDWNTACGSMIGFTVDLLMKYFEIDLDTLDESTEAINTTCGLLAITRFFDKVSRGYDLKKGFVALINGMAQYAWEFAGKPKIILLSGGMTENHIFTSYLKYLLQKDNGTFINLGRYALIDGLIQISKNKGVK